MSEAQTDAFVIEGDFVERTRAKKAPANTDEALVDDKGYLLKEKGGTDRVRETYHEYVIEGETADGQADKTTFPTLVNDAEKFKVDRRQERP